MLRSAKIISLSVWLMILFNLLLSFGAVWHFQRMSPEIKNICDRNVVSLEACEKMLQQLAANEFDQESFQEALDSAAGNITENGEDEKIVDIRKKFQLVKNGNDGEKAGLATAVLELHASNIQAIKEAAEKTQRLRQAGAWAIVLMTLLFFVAAIFFEQRMRRALLTPLEEISSVLEANAGGDRYRRCQESGTSSDMKKLFQLINSLLDRHKA